MTVTIIKKPISLRLDPALYARIARQAASEHRTVTNTIEVALIAYLEHAGKKSPARKTSQSAVGENI